eukprot:m.25441 g.25441  ORF g.25441 m.25441 type:complete len:1157 (+) comp7707_c0_seq1:97-3567(+)
MAVLHAFYLLVALGISMHVGFAQDVNVEEDCDAFKEKGLCGTALANMLCPDACLSADDDAPTCEETWETVNSIVDDCLVDKLDTSIYDRIYSFGSDQFFGYENSASKYEAISGVQGLMVCSRLCHENDACTGVLVGMYGSPRAGECYPIAMDLEDVYIAPYMRLFERRSSYACYLHPGMISNYDGPVAEIMYNGSCLCYTLENDKIHLGCSMDDINSPAVRDDVQIVVPNDIEVMDLSGHEIPNLTEEDLPSNFDDLHTLILRNCSIETVSFGAFGRFPALEKVDISSNNIGKLGGNSSGLLSTAFNKSTNIKELDISGNPFRKVQSTLKQDIGLETLEKITLSRQDSVSTKLKHVDIQAFGDLDIEMSGSPSTCSYNTKAKTYRCNCAKDYGPGLAYSDNIYGCIPSADRPGIPIFETQTFNGNHVKLSFSAESTTQLNGNLSLQVKMCLLNGVHEDSNGYPTCLSGFEKTQTLCCGENAKYLTGCDPKYKFEHHSSISSGFCETGDGNFTLEALPGGTYVAWLETSNLNGYWMQGNKSSVSFEIVGSDQSESSQNAESSTVVLTSSILGVVLVLLILLIAVYYTKGSAKDLPMGRDAFLNALETLRSAGLFFSHYDESPSGKDPNFGVPKEINRKDITLLAVIGEGNFGVVSKAHYVDDKKKAILVAAKNVITNSREEFVREAVINAHFFHENVIRLIGVVTSGEPFLIVLEYCENGSLQSVLKKQAQSDYCLPPESKMSMCLHIARGMAHLTSLNFVHRDLAARNVLVNSDYVCKVADFGLGREVQSKTGDIDGEESAYYRARNNDPLPVRWSSPETLDGQKKFSSASDVWAWGITCCEIFNDGKLPYKGQTNERVWVSVLEKNIHDKPESCSSKFWEFVIKPAFEFKAEDRPTFEELVTNMKNGKHGLKRVNTDIHSNYMAEQTPYHIERKPSKPDSENEEGLYDDEQFIQESKSLKSNNDYLSPSHLETKSLRKNKSRKSSKASILSDAYVAPTELTHDQSLRRATESSEIPFPDVPFNDNDGTDPTEPLVPLVPLRRESKVSQPRKSRDSASRLTKTPTDFEKKIQALHSGIEKRNSMENVLSGMGSQDLSPSPHAPAPRRRSSTKRIRPDADPRQAPSLEQTNYADFGGDMNIIPPVTRIDSKNQLLTE